MGEGMGRRYWTRVKFVLRVHQGAVIVLTITWNCDLDRTNCDPQYDARR